MGPTDIIMVAEELEGCVNTAMMVEEETLALRIKEEARILRLIAGDVEGNLEYWRMKWERAVRNDQQT